MTTVGAEVNAEHRALMLVKLATLNFQVLAVVADVTAVLEFNGVPLIATQVVPLSLEASNWTVAVNAPDN
jgi:hypothetical protein